MNPLLRSGAAHLLVESVEHPVLTDEDVHHLRRVLRLRAGAAFTVTDGQGRWRAVRLGGDGAAEPAGDVVVAPRPSAATVAVSVPKGDRLEWMVQKLTEVGVMRIVLVETERSVVRWDDGRAERHLDRLRRIVREAASQSRRVWLPELFAPSAFAEVLAEPGLAVADPDGEPWPVGGHRAVLVGPEGGFTADELDAIERRGLPRVRVAAHVLRVETAAVVVAALQGLTVPAG